MTIAVDGPATWDPHARTLHRVALAAARPPSPDLFDELVQEMAGSLDATVGPIAVFTRRHLHAGADDLGTTGRQGARAVRISLAGTPCSRSSAASSGVVRGVVEDSASSLFARKGMDSSRRLSAVRQPRRAARPARGDGPRPFTDVALAEAVLKILGSRIAAELERTITDGVLKTAALAVSSARGDVVFAELVRSLAAILHVDAAFIARPSASDPDTMDVLAMQLDGTPVEIGSYPIATSPCAGVLSEGFRVYPERLGDLFPREPMLRAHGIEAYAGYPLTDLAGRKLGPSPDRLAGSAAPPRSRRVVMQIRRCGGRDRAAARADAQVGG
jgi:hypothetical protein